MIPLHYLLSFLTSAKHMPLTLILLVVSMSDLLKKSVP